MDYKVQFRGVMSSKGDDDRCQMLSTTVVGNEALEHMENIIMESIEICSQIQVFKIYNYKFSIMIFLNKFRSRLILTIIVVPSCHFVILERMESIFVTLRVDMFQLKNLFRIILIFLLESSLCPR